LGDLLFEGLHLPVMGHVALDVARRDGTFEQFLGALLEHADPGAVRPDQHQRLGEPCPIRSGWNEQLGGQPMTRVGFPTLVEDTVIDLHLAAGAHLVIAVDGSALSPRQVAQIGDPLGSIP